MRSSIHIDRSLRRLPGTVRVPGDDLLRECVDFLPDPYIERPARTVIGRMRFALMLRQREDLRVPAFSAHAGRRSDRKAQVIADLGSWNALRLILMKYG